MVNATLSFIQRSVAMKKRPRIIYTAQQKALMWERYQHGSSLKDIPIGVRLGKRLNFK